MRELSPGTEFAGHRIEAVAGRGGMGVVYRARQLDLDRIVALKVIAPELLEEPTTRARFLREARAAASIDHPNVIPVFSAGELDGITYLTMRHVAGDDVRSLVRRSGPLEPARAAHIAAQAGSALDAIHAAGLIHRDVKPANVLLGPQDHVYVTDFGLAKGALSDGGETRSGQWVGTLDYVAPEQIRGDRIDARADVYALGGVLYFMLCARPPYVRDGDEARLWAHLNDPPPRPSRHGAPTPFDEVVTRAMAKAPEDRYPSAGDLGRAALAAVAGHAVTVPERVVARGDAAPDAGDEAGWSADAATVPERTTVSATRPDPDARRPGIVAERSPATRRGPSRRAPPVAALAVAGLLGAAGVFALVQIAGEDSGERPTPTITATPAAPAPASTREPLEADAVIRDVGNRPNHVALASGNLFVTAFARDVVSVVDRETGRIKRTVPTGDGASDIAVAGDEVWIALSRTDAVVALDARTGRVRRRLTVRKPNALALSNRSIWVGSRTEVPGQPDELLRFDRSTGTEAQRFILPLGVFTLALTSQELWIGHRRGGRISRLDLATGQVRQLARDLGGGRVVDLATGRGYVWVCTEDGVIARVEPRTRAVDTMDAGGRAGQMTLAAGRLWVSLIDAGELAAIDLATSRRTGANVPVGLSPYGVAADSTSVFVTSRGEAKVTRIDL